MSVLARTLSRREDVPSGLQLAAASAHSSPAIQAILRALAAEIEPHEIRLIESVKVRAQRLVGTVPSEALDLIRDENFRKYVAQHEEMNASAVACIVECEGLLRELEGLRARTQRAGLARQSAQA